MVKQKTYYELVITQFKKNKLAYVALYVMAMFFIIAALADFIANDKPLVCKETHLVQVFSKPSELTGVIYEFINRESVCFCKDSVKSLMESTRKL